MQPIIDNIQVAVKNFENTESFYEALMPILGFDLARKSKGRAEADDFEVIEYTHH